MRFDLRSMLRATCLVVAGLCAVPDVSNAADARQQVIMDAKQNLHRDLQKLEAYLSRGGESVVHGWREYLDLDSLRAELRQPDPDVTKLGEVRHRFSRQRMACTDLNFSRCVRVYGATALWLTRLKGICMRCRRRL